MKNKFPIFFFILIFLSGCARVYNPATERQEMIFIDTTQEVNLGRNISSQIQQKEKLVGDPVVQERVQRVGKKVSLASDRKDLKYKFYVIENKELNAFALPGGIIYINSGLVDKLKTDDEIAAVLAHEIGHVAARHSVKKIQAIMGYQLAAALVLSIVHGQNANQQTAADIGKLSNTAFNLISLGYSRQDELLADRLSIKYLQGAGYNKEAVIKVFEVLKQEGSKSQNSIIFLSSHPDIETRIQKAKEEIQKHNLSLAK